MKREIADEALRELMRATQEMRDAWNAWVHLDIGYKTYRKRTDSALDRLEKATDLLKKESK